MYYTDFVSFMENSHSDELIILAEKANALSKELTLFDYRNLLLKKRGKMVYLKDILQTLCTIYVLLDSNN